MENKMLQMFIYYVMAITDDSSEDYTLNNCKKKIEIAINVIKNQSIEMWNEYLTRPFIGKEHKVLNIQKQLMTLSVEQYMQCLEVCKELLEKYYKYGIDVDESLYLLTSEKDIKNLVSMIILNSKKTNEIKEMVNNIKEGTAENALIINELSNRYAMGSGTEQDLKEAAKGFEMISEYCTYAKRSFAIHLWNGKGVEKDTAKAFKLFNELMQKGDVVSKYYVAEMLYYGEGTEKNIEKALNIFNSLIGNTSKYFEGKALKYINTTK